MMTLPDINELLIDIGRLACSRSTGRSCCGGCASPRARTMRVPLMGVAKSAAKHAHGEPAGLHDDRVHPPRRGRALRHDARRDRLGARRRTAMNSIGEAVGARSTRSTGSTSGGSGEHSLLPLLEGGGGSRQSRRRRPVTDHTRDELTLPEKLMGVRLRTRPHGLVFRKQHRLGLLQLDFFCPERSLAIEVDGINHDMGDRPGSRPTARRLARNTGDRNDPYHRERSAARRG